MALTYVKIASATVGAGGATSIQFNSIDQTFDDLCILTSVRTNDGSGSDQMLVRFNGNNANYSARLLGGNGSSALSVSISGYVMPNNTTGQTASTFNSGQMYIPNYRASTNKSYSSEGVQETNGTSALMWMVAGLWANTSAITSIELYPTASASYVQHSTAVLYGISRT